MNYLVAGSLLPAAGMFASVGAPAAGVFAAGASGVAIPAAAGGVPSLFVAVPASLFPSAAGLHPINMVPKNAPTTRIIRDFFI